jgi:hypothetical protein
MGAYGMGGCVYGGEGAGAGEGGEGVAEGVVCWGGGQDIEY